MTSANRYSPARASRTCFRRPIPQPGIAGGMLRRLNIRRRLRTILWRPPALITRRNFNCMLRNRHRQLRLGAVRDHDRGSVPESAVLASLGCGNPTAVAELQPGETVLDLGSGAGIDVLLSARRVGPSGKAYGLDMTDEMLALALANKVKAGASNVEFLKGYIEAIPLPEAIIDVVISNCVINLAADKSKVFAETFRVLKPGGRLGISDVVASDDLSVADRAERGSYVGCIAGALSFSDYEAGLLHSGIRKRFDHSHPWGRRRDALGDDQSHQTEGITGAVTKGDPRLAETKGSRQPPGWIGGESAPEVLFVCVHNAGRSQMAAGVADRAAKGSIHIRSAGSDPGDEIHPIVREAMAEIGIDISEASPQPLNEDRLRGQTSSSPWVAATLVRSIRGHATSTGSWKIPPASPSSRFGPSVTRSTARACPLGGVSAGALRTAGP